MQDPHSLAPGLAQAQNTAGLLLAPTFLFCFILDSVPLGHSSSPRTRYVDQAGLTLRDLTASESQVLGFLWGWKHSL